MRVFRKNWPLESPPHFSEPSEVGVSYSGSAAETPADGTRITVLKADHPDITPGGMFGLASVHVTLRDVTIFPIPEQEQNSRVILEVSWQSGNGGGEMQVDATQGSYFTLGAFDTINIDAHLESSIEGQPLRVSATKRVEAVVAWQGTVNPKAAFMSSKIIHLLAGNTSAYQPIPLQSMSAIALTKQPGSLATLDMEFSVTNLATNGTKYITRNPNANGTPIVQGTRFFRFANGSMVDMDVFATFELWP